MAFTLEASITNMSQWFAMHPALVMFTPKVAHCQWNPATTTSSTLFLYARATAETSRFCDIQATSVATCCVPHVSLVFGDWITESIKNPITHNMGSSQTSNMSEESNEHIYSYGHPSRIGNPFSLGVLIPLFMDWWWFNSSMWETNVETRRDVADRGTPPQSSIHRTGLCRTISPWWWRWRADGVLSANGVNFCAQQTQETFRFSMI